MSFLFSFLFALLTPIFVLAQTTTIIDPAGSTVVQVITTNIDGIPTTTTIQTLAGTTTGTTATTPTTTTTTLPNQPDQQGPVGQPGPTVIPPNGVTPYTYSTVINGVTQVLTDVFTPTTPATISTTAPATGTIWQYSDWLSVYGAAQASSPPNGSRPALALDMWLVWALVSCVTIGFTLRLQNAVLFP